MTSILAYCIEILETELSSPFMDNELEFCLRDFEEGMR